MSFLQTTETWVAAPEVWSNWVSYFEQLNLYPGRGVHRQSPPTPYKSITRLVPHYRTRQCGFFSYLCDRGRGDIFFRCSDQCILELNPVLPAVVSAPFFQWSQCPTTECLSLYWVWTLQSWHILPFQCYLPALASVHTPSDLLRRYLHWTLNVLGSLYLHPSTSSATLSWAAPPPHFQDPILCHLVYKVLTCLPLL